MSDFTFSTAKFTAPFDVEIKCNDVQINWNAFEDYVIEGWLNRIFNDYSASFDNEFIIAVDFDGTIITDTFPDLNEPYTPNKPIIKLIKMAKERGYRLILWTSRSGELLDKALKFCSDNDIQFDCVNECFPGFDTGGRKIFAHCYLDDRNFNPHEIDGLKTKK